MAIGWKRNMSCSPRLPEIAPRCFGPFIPNWPIFSLPSLTPLRSRSRLGYRKATFDHPLKGFGFLVPKKERKYMAACTWVGNKFNYRVPDDLVLLRCFMGGNALAETDDSLVEAARRELRSIMGLQSEPLFHSIARWPGFDGAIHRRA